MLACAPATASGKALPEAASGTLREASPAGSAVSKKNEDNADWGTLVELLRLTGMARMLAQHCELVHRDDQRIELSVPKVHERLLDKPYQDKLRAALQQHFGATLRVAFRVGDGNGNSPAALADRERQRRQAEAVAEIEQDPFVRELVENFDARIVESTIKPIQQQDAS
jgi:DNA polymerase-3 subunit gamma/tau